MKVEIIPPLQTASERLRDDDPPVPTHRVSRAAIQAATKTADELMQRRPDLRSRWERRVCQMDAPDLLLTNYDWPIQFLVWYVRCNR